MKRPFRVEFLNGGTIKRFQRWTCASTCASQEAADRVADQLRRSLPGWEVRVVNREQT